MNVVVVGGGLAGAAAVAELREQGFTGHITLLAAEPHLPYERPPLSKGLLLGTATEESAQVHDAGWYERQHVDLRTGTAASRIDTGAATVHAGGEAFGYDRLLLATGAVPRHLPMVDDAGVPALYLRTLEDSRALREQLTGRREQLTGRLLVVGAGWIGLEAAAAARASGAAVTVVETADVPLRAALGAELGTVFADLHVEHGVDLRLDTGLDSLTRTADGRARATLSDGHTDEYDLVVVGIGVMADEGLAQSSGLATGNGVLVDSRLRTSDPHVYAAGDVANHDHPVLGRRIRVEHWDTALHQGRHAARSMLGDETPYERLPYFFTDQYDLGMEYVGSVGPDGYDEVVLRGDREARVLTALYLRGDRVVAGMHLNDWDAIDPLRALVGESAPEGARDPGVPLADLVAASG